MIADKSKYLQLILEHQLISLLRHIWGILIQEQIKGAGSLADKDLLLKTKIEVIFCIGNCTTSVLDTVYLHGLELLMEAVNQGALKILVEALGFELARTCSFGLTVALDSLHRYFSCYKETLMLESLEAELYVPVFHKLMDEFEFSLQGLDAVERC